MHVALQAALFPRNDMVFPSFSTDGVIPRLAQATFARMYAGGSIFFDDPDLYGLRFRRVNLNERGH